MSKLALVSVYDKTGLEEFVRGLASMGISILSTGGTAQFLTERGFQVLSVDDYTGSPEILGGRVKTLHPRIHGGILARRDNLNDLNELLQFEIKLIDIVVVNLYPFLIKEAEIATAANPNHPSLVEFIDIGGPTMIRAAAKNCKHVLPICDPSDYGMILDQLKSAGDVGLPTRQLLASKVFRTMAAYDASVARYFALQEQVLTETGERRQLSPIEAVVLQRKEELRYGENPHQAAALYEAVSVGSSGTAPAWTQLQGKELSYNNLLDMQGALDLFLELLPISSGRQVAVIIKHSNPCGVAVRKTNVEAYTAARDCDPISAFGGIIAVSGEMTKALAETILEGFVEVVLTEKITEEAKQIFQSKKNIRVLLCDFKRLGELARTGWTSVRNAFGDYLLQTSDNKLSALPMANVVAGEKPAGSVLDDLQFAWAVCKHVKSNAIVIAKDLQAIGVGAGQMNRVDSARFAIQRASSFHHDLKGAVAASDAFLPFPDTLEVLNDAGIKALVQPGGSVKDDEVIEAAKSRGITMLLTGQRHFRH